MIENRLNQKELINEIEKVHNNFINTLSKFTEKELNTIPFEGSWTAAQVAEHATKSNQGILAQLLNGKSKSINRSYNEQVEIVKQVFLSKEKMKSAAQLEPSLTLHNKASLVTILKKQKEQQIECVNEKDLKALISELDFPSSPNGLTRYEWLFVMIEHAKRHIKQIENIYKKLQ